MGAAMGQLYGCSYGAAPWGRSLGCRYGAALWGGSMGFHRGIPVPEGNARGVGGQRGGVAQPTMPTIPAMPAPCAQLGSNSSPDPGAGRSIPARLPVPTLLTELRARFRPY